MLGVAATWVFARMPESIGAFAPVASVAAAALSFGIADVLGGSGFLAVYLVGLAVGSTPSRYRRQLVAFHEGLAFLAQVAMFVVLGLLVFPRDLPDVALAGLAAGGAARLRRSVPPRSGSRRRSATSRTASEPLLGWAGLRGAVPIVLGTFVLSSQSPARETIFNAVFFVVVVSALSRGRRSNGSRRGSGWRRPAPAVVPPPLDVDGLGSLDLVDFAVAGDHAIAGSAVRELGLPRSALVAVISRGRETIPPRGSTVIEAGDRLFVLLPRTKRADLDDVFSRWRRRV